MPYGGTSKDQDKKIERCVSDLTKKGTSKNRAIAICKDSVMKGESANEDWHHIKFFVPIKESNYKRDVNSDEFVIAGTAINATTTLNHTTFLAEELEPSASSLIGKPLLKDHINSVDAIVGRVTNGVFNSNKVDFEAKVTDKAIQQKIRNGDIMNVSVGAFLNDLEEVEDEETGNVSLIARGIQFIELSLVAVPADQNAGFAMAIAESWNMKKASNESVDISSTEFIKEKSIVKNARRKILKEVNMSSDIGYLGKASVTLKSNKE